MWLLFLLTGAGIVLYLLFWPIEAQPEAWTPPEAPALEGVYAVNRRLLAMERLSVGGEGPEDLAFDAQGRIYSGLRDGRIVRLRVDGSELETFAHTGGEPLGLQDPTGSFNMVTAAVEHDGALYLGSFVEDAIGRLWLR